MERSIATLKVNTIKTETRNKNDIKKRTKENTTLIVELNSVKFEKKKLENDILQKVKDINKVEETLQELKLKQQESMMASQKKVLPNEMGGESDKQEMPSLLKGASAESKKKDNKFAKGTTPYLKKKENIEDKARIAELNQQLDENN